MPDYDPLGLQMPQEYHTAILAWLQSHNAKPTSNGDETQLFTPDGTNITNDFLDTFQEEFDYFEIVKSDPLEVAIYTTDYNIYRCDTLVRWTGTAWEFLE